MRITIKSVALTAIAALFALTSCNNDLKADIEAVQAEQELQNFQSGDNQVASLETQIEAMNAATDMFTKEIAPKLSAIGTWLKDTESELTNANKALAKAIETKSAAADFLTAVDAFKTVADKAVEAGQKLEGPEDFALETLCTQLAAYKDAIEETIKATDKSVAEKNAQAKVYAAAAKAAGDAAIKTINKHASDNAEATAALTDKMVPALQARVKASLDAIVSIHEALSGKPTAEAIKAAYALFEETTNANVLAMEDVLLGTIKGRLDTAGFTNFKNAYLNRFDGYEAWKIYVDATLVKHASEIAKLRADLEDEVAALQEQIDDLYDECDILYDHIDSVKDDLQQQIDKINAYIGSVKDNLQQQIDTIDKTIEAIQKDLEGVHVEMDKMGKSIEAIQKDLLGVHGEINTINGKIVTINTEIEKLWKAVNLLNADKDTEGSVKYYVEQLRINLQAQIDALAARVTINEAKIRALKARIQSLVFVPRYTDMKFGIPFSVIKADTYEQYEAYNEPENGFEIVYKVAPADLAEPLAAAVNAVAAAPSAGPVFTFDVEYGLQTRAPAPPAEPGELTILKATGDNTTGKIAFRLHHKNFDGYGVNYGYYAISLRVDDESADATVPEVKKGIHVASEFVQVGLQPSSQVDIDMQYVYKAKADGTGVDLDSRIKLKNDNAATDTDFEVSRALPYTTKDTFAPYKDYELAATITTGGLKTGPFTYAQLREKGYNMPIVGVTVEKKSTTCSYLVLEGTGTASTVKVDNTSMKNVKTHHNNSATPGWGEEHTLGLNYAFETGLGNYLNMQALVSIDKTDLVFGFNFPYAFTWTYEADKGKDHLNRPYGSYSHSADYTRAWDGTPSFTVTPVLASVNGTALTTPLELDGSNDVYGLEPSDFNGKAFTKVSTPSNFDVDMDISTGHVDDANKTLSPDGVTVKAKLGGTYSGTGKYTLDLAATAVNVNYTITTTDRKTDEIIITAPKTDGIPYPTGVTATATTTSLNRFGVVLLGGTSATDGGSYSPHYDYSQGTSGSYVRGWCHQGCNVYGVTSGDIASAMYNAFKDQGIFSSADYASATAALADNKEFDKNFIYVNNSNNMSTFGGKYYNFVLYEDGSSIVLKSNMSDDYYGYTHSTITDLPNTDHVYDFGFQSATLKAIAQAYPDAHEGVDYSADTYTQRFLTYSFYTYVGQKVTLYWSFTAEAPKNTNYALKPNVDLSYDSTNKYWYYNVAPTYQYAVTTADKSYINQVYTHMNMQRQIGVYDGATLVANNDASYRDTRHVYPKFSLVASGLVGINMKSIPDNSPYVNSDWGDTAIEVQTQKNANVLTYYGQDAAVAVKAELFVDSDNVSFPLTHKVVSGSNKLDNIYVQKYNPFREAVNQPLTITCDAQPHGTTFTLPLTFKDKLGYDIIYQGNFTDPFSNNGCGSTLASLGAVYGIGTSSVSLIEVDGAAPTGGWALNVTTVDPPMVKVTVPSGATHETHTLKIKVSTKWEDYTYTATVPVY